MKLQILQENLSKAVGIASRFTSSRAQLPVLGNILFRSNKTKLFVASTNLEISVSIALGAKVEEEGEISIPSKVIAELITNLPKETVSLESEKEQMKILSTGFSSTVLGMATSDFPKIPVGVSKEGMITLPKKDFSEALSSVVFASSSDETRPVLTGVLFVFEKEELTLVATDGFRLSQKKIKVPGVKSSLKLVLPKLILTEISRSAEEVNEISFNYNEKEKQAIFEIGDMVLSSRLLDGEYPDFKKILPKSSSVKIEADREELLRAVKLSSVFARDAANIVKLKILKDSVRITAESGQSGKQEMSVDASVKKSPDFVEPFETAFNFHFLEDFLHSVKGDSVSMEFSGPTAAGVFKDSKDSEYLHLIMPVKVQG